MRPLALVMCVLVLGACTQVLSPETMSAVDSATRLSDVTANSAVIGKTLLAGGVVLGVDQREDATWLELLDWELDAQGEPVSENPTGLRYFVVVDPTSLPVANLSGRLVTLAGTAQNPAVVERMGRRLVYPVLELVELHLWPRPVDHHPARLGLAPSPSWRGMVNPDNPYDSGYAPYPWTPGQLRP